MKAQQLSQTANFIISLCQNEISWRENEILNRDWCDMITVLDFVSQHFVLIFRDLSFTSQVLFSISLGGTLNFSRWQGWSQLKTRMVCHQNQKLNIVQGGHLYVDMARVCFLPKFHSAFITISWTVHSPPICPPIHYLLSASSSLGRIACNLLEL